MTYRSLAVALAVVVAACAPGRPAWAQVLFSDVTGACGLTAQQNEDGMASGLTAVDYDADGYVDLFVPQGDGQPNQLYRNDGDGTFSEIAGSVGLASTESARVALWFDYDADHDLDLLVYNDDTSLTWRFRLYRQDGGGFTDATLEAGLNIGGFLTHCAGMCAGDINNDGFLDLFVGSWGGARRLLLNDGVGGFSNVTVPSGVGGLAGPLWQPMMFDFNGDGWQDLYIAVDDAPNELWINQQDGTFVENASSAGLANAMNDMGMTLGDYDNDGDLDVYITNIYRNGPPFGFRNNVLLRNDSSGGVLSFTDVSAAMGVEYGGWGWGVSFMDCDNDSLLDIAATNGFGNWDGTNQNGDASVLYRNVGGASPFQDISAQGQFNDMDWGSALVALDYDRDGDQDLAQLCMSGPLRLLSNELPTAPGAHNYLVVKPRSIGRNHFAIGAVVRAEIGSLTMTRLITCGTSCLGQEPAEAFFGVGTASIVDRVSVVWPDGTETELTNVVVNQVLPVMHNVAPPPPPIVCVGDINDDGATDVFDFTIFSASFGSSVFPGEDGDLNGDATVDVFDFAIFASDFGCVE